MQLYKRIAMLIALMGGPFSGLALAANDYAHGSVCNPVQADAAKVDYTPSGVVNINAMSFANVQCHVGNVPTSVAAPLNVTASIVVFDRHASQNVCCTLRWQRPDGVANASQARCSNGFASGAQYLSYSINPPPTGVLTATCSIPPQAEYGQSGISSFRFTK